jgi:hypothetical protein
MWRDLFAILAFNYFDVRTGASLLDVTLEDRTCTLKARWRMAPVDNGETL